MVGLSPAVGRGPVIPIHEAMAATLKAEHTASWNTRKKFP